MYSIKTGFWVDWEQGAVKGATLTLPIYYGLILVSFLTLFVQFSGGCFWRTLCFVLHQTRSTTSPRDGLYHQQQIILRNAITAPNALWSLIRSATVWNSKVKAPIGRSLPLFVILTVHIGCFAVAGLFSSQVASTQADNALIKSDKCGYPQKLPSVRSAYSITNLSDSEVPIFNTQVLLGRYTVTESASYVRSCYNDDAGASVDCSHFVRRNLMEKGSADFRAACPFGGNSCATDAVRFDSGHVNSNIDLGLNTPMRDSITFRRVTTCAPIKADQYATGWQDNLTEAYTGKGMTRVKFYEFGKGETGCVATPAKQTTNSTTFCVSQWMKDSLTGAYLTTANTAYVAMANASDFVPIPDFSMNNADVTLLSIFNKAIYTAKVDDALFSAQNASNKNSQFYTATHDLSVLACMEQYQFCNPRTDKCTNLTGLYATQDAVNNGDLELSGRQQAAFKILWQAGWAMALQWTAKLMNSRVLLAQDWVFTTTATGSGPLQSDQWQRESFNLHNLSLAVFQHRLNQYAAPETFQLSSNLNAADHLDVPTDPDMLDLCKRQRILTSKYYNVSVLGMSIILAVGTLLIIVSQVVEKVWFDYFNPESRLSKQADWTQTGTLQLHRQALEARGIGSWDRKNQDFPVMDAPGTTFIGLGAREERIGQMQVDEKSPYQLVAGEVSTDEKQGFRSP